MVIQSVTKTFNQTSVGDSRYQWKQTVLATLQQTEDTIFNHNILKTRISSNKRIAEAECWAVLMTSRKYPLLSDYCIFRGSQSLKGKFFFSSPKKFTIYSVYTFLSFLYVFLVKHVENVSLHISSKTVRGPLMSCMGDQIIFAGNLNSLKK